MGSFTFRQFEIRQDRCAMKVGTDGVLLGAWAEGGKRILDIGSGTGLISLMMAQRFPEARVVGIDMDEEACLQARENVAASPFADRVEIVASRLQDFSVEASQLQDLSVEASQFRNFGVEASELRGFRVEADGTSIAKEAFFDAIVSNPPFFLNSLKNPDSKRSMARHADSLPFRDLFAGVKRLLSEEGVFSAVIPVEVLEPFEAEACFSGLSLVRKCLIRTVERKQPKRCLLAFAKHRCGDLEVVTECLMDAAGGRSSWYAKITEDFYVK